jgi:hypothetical protein
MLLTFGDDHTTRKKVHFWDAPPYPGTIASEVARQRPGATSMAINHSEDNNEDDEAGDGDGRGNNAPTG